MKRDTPKYVVWLTGAGGRKYLTFKRRGEPTRRFECQDMQSPAFWTEYATILNGTSRTPGVLTVSRLIGSYCRSSAFSGLAPRTAAIINAYRMGLLVRADREAD